MSLDTFDLVEVFVSPVMWILRLIAKGVGWTIRKSIRVILQLAWVVTFWIYIIRFVTARYMPEMVKYAEKIFNFFGQPVDWWTKLKDEIVYVWQHNPEVLIMSTLMIILVAMTLYDKLVQPWVLGFVPERAVPGSPLAKGTAPRCQVEVYGRNQGTGWYFSGCAIRVSADRYVVPLHVVAHMDEMKLVRGDVEIRVPVDKIEPIHGDLAFLLVKDSDSSLLGTAVGKLSRVAVRGSVTNFVKCCSKERESMGSLREYKDFGLVEYQGSTLPGFSGAAYTQGNVVMGMHIGCQTVNVGYDAAYIRAILVKRSQVVSQNEETEGFLTEVLRSNPEVDWRISPGDPDEILLYSGGSYHTIDRTKWHKVRNEMSYESVMPPLARVAYQDLGNELPGPARLAVGVTAPGLIMGGMDSVSPSNGQMHKTTPTFASHINYETNRTARPQSTPAPRNGVSPCTSTRPPSEDVTILNARIRDLNLQVEDLVKRRKALGWPGKNKKPLKRASSPTPSGSGFSPVAAQSNGSSESSTDV